MVQTSMLNENQSTVAGIGLFVSAEDTNGGKIFEIQKAGWV